MNCYVESQKKALFAMLDRNIPAYLEAKERHALSYFKIPGVRAYAIEQRLRNIKKHVALADFLDDALADMGPDVFGSFRWTGHQAIARLIERRAAELESGNGEELKEAWFLPLSSEDIERIGETKEKAERYLFMLEEFRKRMYRRIDSANVRALCYASEMENGQKKTLNLVFKARRNAGRIDSCINVIRCAVQENVINAQAFDELVERYYKNALEEIKMTDNDVLEVYRLTEYAVKEALAPISEPISLVI